MVVVKTFTGSLMPKGSDTFSSNWKCWSTWKKNKKIIKPVPFGFAVRNIGENYKKDEVLIKKGTIIGFSEVGVMAF